MPFRALLATAALCVAVRASLWAPTSDGCAFHKLHCPGVSFLRLTHRCIADSTTVKTLWFGSNTTGIDSPDTLALIANHTVGGFGWQTFLGNAQQGTNEAQQAAVVSNLASFLRYSPAASPAPNRVIFQYRQVQVALDMFAMNALANKTAPSDAWLHQDGQLCLKSEPGGDLCPYWNFSSPSAIESWMSTTVDQLAHDFSLHGVPTTGAVFFDENDQSFCGYTGGSCDFTKFDKAALHAGTNNMLRQMVTALNAAGLVPILSLDNMYTAAGKGLPDWTPPCALPEDATATALEGLTWVRFYENFPRSFWTSVPAPQLVASIITNSIIEGAAGIPTMLRVSMSSCPPRRVIARPGPLGGAIVGEIAAYLIVQTPGTTLGLSSGWEDGNWCWHQEYEVEFGTPKGPATRQGLYMWTREYTRAMVMLDVETGDLVGNVTLLA